MGPVYYFRSTDDIPPIPEGFRLVPDYYAGKRFEEYDSAHVDEESKENVDGTVDASSEDKQVSFDKDLVQLNNKYPTASETEQTKATPLEKTQTTAQLWFSMLKKPAQWPRLLWLVISHGWTQDVITNQVTDGGFLSPDIKLMHSKSKYYDNKVEYLFSLLQTITACTMSFAHGSNDISNAAGPLATVYQIWTTNVVNTKADVPIWVLCYTAGALVLGCWTFGYNIMRNLGNKLTLQSPSRGFSIELGAAVTTVMATRLAIPVSTTQSAVGATVFVGLCNKEWKAVNWRIVAFCYGGWIFTLPCAGLIAGIINGIIINAPSKNTTYELTN
jgi:sodium-dependent phosphate transporter